MNSTEMNSTGMNSTGMNSTEPKAEVNKTAQRKKNVELEGKTILVTGSPGFIGANLVLRLLKDLKTGTVISMDSMTDYYDVNLKKYRLNLIEQSAAESGVKHIFTQSSVADEADVRSVFEKFRPAVVVNLAAQAGVRYSIENPKAYIDSNIIGFFNILEACRHCPVEHLVYASSSSVYGGNTKIPFSTEDKTDTPVSLYAATKKCNELLCHSYSQLYGIPATGLRFFTVYGPCGRPDMFYFSATNALVRGEKIKLFNYGNCKRDFTYIDDITEGILRVMKKAPSAGSTGPGSPDKAPHALYNIGGGQPENLMTFINTLVLKLRQTGILSPDFNLEKHIEPVEMQPGDVPVTFADSSGLEKDFGFRPSVPTDRGLEKFALWYKDYYC